MNRTIKDTKRNYCLVVSFIILFIVLSCELLSCRVFIYTVHCIVLWNTVLSCLLLYCSLYCPVNYYLFVSFIVLLIVLSWELLSCRVFYCTAHCIVLWTTVVSFLLLYCSFHCPSFNLPLFKLVFKDRTCIGIICCFKMWDIKQIYS
jgi:hypothetical protein